MGGRREGKVVFSVNGIRLRCDLELSHCENCELLLKFHYTPQVNETHLLLDVRVALTL